MTPAERSMSDTLAKRKAHGGRNLSPTSARIGGTGRYASYYPFHFSDDDTALLKALPNLEWLSLEGCQITDRSLATVASFSKP